MKATEPLFAGPLHVDMDLTNACNLACSHCHAASGKPLPSELDTAEICGILTQVYELGALSVTLAGGEPFMRSDILDILKHCQSMPGLDTTVVTNAALLTGKRIELLRRHCPDIGLSISIDGSTAESFALSRHRRRRDARTNEKLFELVKSNARATARAGIRTSVSFVLSKASCSDLDATYRLAIEDIGADSVTAIRFFPTGYGAENREVLELNYDEWADAVADLTDGRQAGIYDRLFLSVAKRVGNISSALESRIHG